MFFFKRSFDLRDEVEGWKNAKFHFNKGLRNPPAD